MPKSSFVARKWKMNDIYTLKQLFNEIGFSFQKVLKDSSKDVTVVVIHQ